eukprot:gnl/TRDRNA2_/TRDRNA2_177775_c0_seq2.p1 gnl/TRDRNA2_/TRDRNA2_177775_c0~~gnl/TRDRNA2_/TRDRNA2_177775_c0_seq2.p1  ORF type:complete len:316 (+),score=2.84 gnl/TRDRNA2_/TRDRNA2_177775_c0_seq2:75-1022(+)
MKIHSSKTTCSSSSQKKNQISRYSKQDKHSTNDRCEALINYHYELNKAKLADKIERYLQKHTIDVSMYPEVSHFNDPDITQNFVWKKKIETKLQKGNLIIGDYSIRAEHMRRRCHLRKIISVNKIRRAREKAQFDNDSKTMDKERLNAEGEILSRNEARCYLRDAILRAQYRLNDGRPEPFDLIIKNFSPSEEIGLDPDPPFTTLSDLPLWKLKEVEHNISMFCELVNGEDKYSVEFWQHMTTVVEQEIEEVKRREHIKQTLEEGVIMSRKKNPELSKDSQIFEELNVYLNGKKSVDLLKIENVSIITMQSTFFK